MTFLQSIVLGIVQGLGEFLPISSSAHLILVPWLLGWADHGLTFDIALHLGTLVALLIYFRKDWFILARDVVLWRQGFQTKLGMLLVLGTIPGAVIGLILEKKVETVFRNPLQVGIILIIMGSILWILDRRGKKQREIQSLSVKDALLIGLAQGIAVIPGVSRSGSTISAALALGLTRESAARFSFLLSLPITAGACLLKLRHLTMADLTPEFFTGILTSFIFGYLAIGGLIRFLQTRSYGVFAIYRWILGLLVIVLYLNR